MLPDKEKFLNLKQLPARLSVEETAWYLGFASHDIQILMGAGKLAPLGDPAPNAPKWFASIEVIRLATDRDWLHKATKEVSKYWRQKRERHHFPLPSSDPVLVAAPSARPSRKTTVTREAPDS